MTVATTGSRLATIDAFVALMCRSAPTSSENVTIVPITTMKATSAQTGAEYSERFPWSETSSPRVSHGKFQSGLITAQRSAANRKP